VGTRHGRLTLLSAPELLTARHDISEFSCGKPGLDHWLKTRALANQERGFTVVMVVHDAGRVVGYYGLAPTAVVPTALPRSIKTGQPPNPVPCLLLGQLAIDQAWAGQGIGTSLLRDAFGRAVAGARLVGGRALIVKALDSEAANFWKKRGFLPSRDDPLTFYRSLSDIVASLEAAASGWSRS
jgi:GNAT superfamily N-acetyltransferase